MPAAILGNDSTLDGMQERRVEPIATPIDAVIPAAASKSATHRALVAAALARGTSLVRRPLLADDTRVTFAGLSALGIDVSEVDQGWRVAGCGGRVPGGGDLRLGDSGTSLRLLLALAALGARASRLDGSPRLRQRPLRGLAQALQALGARVRCSPQGEGLPLEAGGRAPSGDAVRLPAVQTSQFSSALLLVGACLPRGLALELSPPLVSMPYLELTLGTLEEFGVRVARPGLASFRIEPQTYRGRDVTVEGDHSSASYFLAAAAVLGGRVRVTGLRPDSRQADARLGAILERSGCPVSRGTDWVEVRSGGGLCGIDVDLGDAPDLAPTLAMLSLFAPGPSVLRGVGHLRVKESDRLELLAENLRRLGRPAQAREDRLEVAAGSTSPQDATVRTGSDHRMAMAFAIVGLRRGVTLDDGDCVSKSNPRFWEQLARLAPRRRRGLTREGPVGRDQN
jgi:3-phosphoshikimate 1-carboxyvinyltransferase